MNVPNTAPGNPHHCTFCLWLLSDMHSPLHHLSVKWKVFFFVLKQILVKLLQSKHVFLWQTTDKEAPGLVRMHTMAYLSGFPGSLKETEQLRVKLPAVVTSKIKQVKLLN